MTVRKTEKKLANVYQHKNMSILILNMHTNVCDIRICDSFNWFYNTLVKLVLQYSKVYERVMSYFDYSLTNLFTD